MIDLHMHTNYSDGTDTLIELLKKAEERKLEIISITDHENCNVYDEIKNINISDYYSGKLIKGIEMQTTIEGVGIEILGYGIDTDIVNPRVKNMYLPHQRKSEIEFERLYEKSKEAGIILADDFMEKYNKNEYTYAATYLHKRMIENEENKKIIQDEGAWKDHLVFYRKYMSDPKNKLYTDVSDLMPTCETVIQLIRDAGGLVFIPHIYIYGVNYEKVFSSLISNYEIDGIECMYSTFTEEQTDYLMDFCRKNNLYMSGGSDYHGLIKPDIELGIGRGNLNISYDLVKDWINKNNMSI